MDYKKMATAFAAGGAVLAAGAAYSMKQKNNKKHPNVNFSSGGGRSVYLSDTSLASLAVAAYLIRDYNFDGENIHIFQKEEQIGGGCSLGVASGALLNDDFWLNEKYCPNFWELFRSIPSCNQNDGSVKGDIIHQNRSAGQSLRILRSCALESKMLGKKERHLLERLVLTPEVKLEKISISDWFGEHTSFFLSDFWMELRSLFGLKENVSVSYLRETLLWRNEELKQLPMMKEWIALPSHPAQSLIEPLYRYLKGYGVHFHKNTEIEDVLFSDTYNLRARTLIINNGKCRQEINLKSDDLCICTLGPQEKDVSFGSMNKSFEAVIKKEGLWNHLASHRSELNVPGQLLEPKDGAQGTFVFTFKRKSALDVLFSRLEDADCESVVCLADSNWGVTWNISSHSFVSRQDDLTMWGTILYPYEQGDYIRKTFDTCNGKEVLTELLSHILNKEETEKILNDCVEGTICLLPYAYAAKLAENESVLTSPKLNDSNFAVLSPYRMTKTCGWLEQQITSAHEAVLLLMRASQVEKKTKAKMVKQQTLAIHYLHQRK